MWEAYRCCPPAPNKTSGLSSADAVFVCRPRALSSTTAAAIASSVCLHVARMDGGSGSKLARGDATKFWSTARRAQLAAWLRCLQHPLVCGCSIVLNSEQFPGGWVAVVSRCASRCALGWSGPWVVGPAQLLACVMVVNVVVVVSRVSCASRLTCRLALFAPQHLLQRCRRNHHVHHRCYGGCRRPPASWGPNYGCCRPCLTAASGCQCHQGWWQPQRPRPSRHSHHTRHADPFECGAATSRVCPIRCVVQSKTSLAPVGLESHSAKWCARDAWDASVEGRTKRR